MNISSVNFVSNFSNITQFRGGKHVINSNSKGFEDTFVNKRKQTANEIAKYLKSGGIKAKVSREGFLEVSNLNNLARLQAIESDIKSNADYLLQYTKKIRGSVDFGKINASTLGRVEVLEGLPFRKNIFDFSKSEISDLGNLQRVEGSIIITPEQLINIDFEGLKVSDEVMVSIPKAGFHRFKILDEYNKNALLAGFKILNY